MTLKDFLSITDQMPEPNDIYCPNEWIHTIEQSDRPDIIIEFHRYFESEQGDWALKYPITIEN